MLTMHDFSIRSHHREIISPFHFDMKNGERVFLLGASGTGKTLILEKILGHLPRGLSFSGEIYLSPNLKIGYLPQTVDYLNPKLKIGKLYDHYFSKRLDPEEFLLPKNVYNLYPHELSGGMARRVLLMFLYPRDWDLLLLDEPTVGLDKKTREVVFEHFFKKFKNKSFLIVTHEWKYAFDHADTILVLNEGQLIEKIVDKRPKTDFVLKSLEIALKGEGIHD